MEKRNFLKFLALSSSAFLLKSPMEKLFAQNQLNLIKAKALKQGDSVRIISPGTAVNDPDDINKANEIVKSLGLIPIFSNNLLAGSGYKTRTVKERIDDIHEAFSDDNAKAVFCIRGGYGSGQLLDSIDYQLIRNNPKIFCGYSDITALHLAINKYSGLVTFHSPVLLSPFTSFTQEIFVKLLFNSEIYGKISNPSNKSGLRTIYPIRTIVSGKASGQIIGGNLSLISSLVGTKYQIDTKDKILAFEDVGESPYRIDRMLNQLRLSGILENAKGFIIGKCSDCTQDQATWDWSLGEVLDYYIKPLNKPAFYGLLFGHTSEQITIPLGINVTIDADLGTLNLDEQCVI